MYNSGAAISSNDSNTGYVHKVRGTVAVGAEAVAGTETINVINGETLFVGMDAVGTEAGTATLEMKLVDVDDQELVATGEKARATAYVTGTIVPLFQPVEVEFEISGTVADAFSVPYTIYYKK